MLNQLYAVEIVASLFHNEGKCIYVLYKVLNDDDDEDDDRVFVDECILVAWIALGGNEFLFKCFFDDGVFPNSLAYYFLQKFRMRVIKNIKLNVSPTIDNNLLNNA